MFGVEIGVSVRIEIGIRDRVGIGIRFGVEIAGIVVDLFY